MVTFTFYHTAGRAIEAFTDCNGATRAYGVTCKDDLSKFDSVYVTQDGGYFYVFADRDHERSYDGNPLCFIDTGLDPVFGDFAEAAKARRIAHNALCTYTAVTFDGE